MLEADVSTQKLRSTASSDIPTTICDKKFESFAADALNWAAYPPSSDGLPRTGFHRAPPCAIHGR
jgi:hypothetical protein